MHVLERDTAAFAENVRARPLSAWARSIRLFG